MYIQFYNFYDMLQHFVKPKFAKQKHYMFHQLFSSVPEAIPDKTGISKIINNHAPVPLKIRTYYDENGIEPLAADIQEKVFPKLISAHEFADQLYWNIRKDPLLPSLLKHTVAENYPPEEESALALYIATALYTIMSRPHYPSKKNMEPVLPQWITDNVPELLLSRNVPSPSFAFTGRSGELKQLHELLRKQQYVVVWGIHGIGKSELVYRYCEDHKSDYRKILYVNSCDDLKKDLCKLHIVGNVSTTGNMFFDVMQCLRSLREDTLLVIDNANSIEDQKFIWELIQQSGCKLLVTTRCQMPENLQKEHLELNAIASMRSLVGLIKKLSGRKNLKTVTLEKLIVKLHRHTTALVLLSALLQTDRYTPEEILEQLGSLKLKDFIKERLFFRNDCTSFYNHLRNLFRLFCFEGLERYALQNMALVPQDGVPLKLFETWTELTDTDIMDSLINMGLIYRQSYNTAIHHRRLVSLKPTLKGLACEELIPSIRSCAKLIHNTAKAMNDLVDDQDMQYLIDVSQEVIAQAEKDDIPVYIDYLHKSFEAAARYNQTEEMQAILEDLENALAVTPYGTSMDMALMLDYRAMVQNIPTDAIAYRRKAIELLDPEIPEEKQLQAVILERISGDYLMCHDWKHAKLYSDASWSLFRELGMLEKPEAFSMYQRRGVLLCHAGAAAEGLALLHQLEKYIYDFESQPTQNRVSVQTALQNAYEAIGNLEEAKKYEYLSMQSLNFLKNRMESDT